MQHMKKCGPQRTYRELPPAITGEIYFSREKRRLPAILWTSLPFFIILSFSTVDCGQWCGLFTELSTLFPHYFLFRQHLFVDKCGGVPVTSSNNGGPLAAGGRFSLFPFLCGPRFPRRRRSFCRFCRSAPGFAGFETLLRPLRFRR